MKQLSRICHFALVTLSVSCFAVGCDDDSPARPDTTPPARVLDLRSESIDDTSVALAWTAPDDVEGSGTSNYDLRYSLAGLTDSSWDEATVIIDSLRTHSPGTEERFSITGLTRGTAYDFGLKTADLTGNWSGVSNIR